MESYWLRSMTKKKNKKSQRAAKALGLGRAVQQLRQGAGTSGRERRRRAVAAPAPPGTAAGSKFRELQALVPGAEGLRADRLLLRTAGYILHLRRQVHLLRVLSVLYEA